MARLIYGANTSLDGYVADENGNFDWAEPTEEVHTFFNNLIRPIGTHLYGRRMYETMVAWEDPALVAGQPVVMHEFASIWQAADKVVYSRTLDTVSSARTRIERDFDVDAVRQMKATSARDLLIGGAELAAQALRAGLVDDYYVVVVPIIIGGGHSALPDGLRLQLELVEERRFDNGSVMLHYRVLN
jgi:dihydrofolate reductase